MHHSVVCTYFDRVCVFILYPFLFVKMSDSDSNNYDKPTTPLKKRRLRNCIFNDNWMKDSRFSNWLAKHDDINKARCIYCMNVFSVKYDGVNAVQSHSNSKKHISTVQSRQKSAVIKNYFVTQDIKENDAVAAIELSKCFHCVKHHHSYLSTDCGVKLELKHFSDATLAKKIRLGRTKMEALVQNVLCPFAIEVPLKKLKYPINLPFSLSTDASNKGNRKFFPLAVRFFDLEKGAKDYLLDFYEEPDETSESIFNTILRAIENFGLDIQNITAFGADNASVNYGKNCSVYEKLLKKKPSIIKANCNCHVLHNTAKHSLKLLKYDVETLVIKVFNEFSISAKRITELKDCFEFVQQDFHNVLRHISVRWLSLYTAVDRLILNWSAIKIYFLKKGKNNCDRIIWKFIKDQVDGLSKQLTLSECYIWFVHHILSVFQKSILMLEKKNLNATDVFDIMNDLRNQISNRKNDEFFGITVTTTLNGLTLTEKNEFKTSALLTYQRAIDYLEKWFNFESSPFKLFTCLKLHNKIPSIMELSILAKCIGIQVNENELYDEINLLKLMPDNVLNNCELTSSEKWIKFFQMSSVEVPNLKSIVRYVYSVPCSNAFVERIFSHMNGLWTEERNRLGVDTVKAELVIQNNLLFSCSEFFDFVKDQTDLLAAARLCTKYKFKK